MGVSISTVSMMQSYCAIYFFLLLAVPLVCHSQQLDDERGEKLISTFQIVRFPNDVCVGTNARNGTCYTSAECSDKDGTSSGSCADGFGVCCTFIISTCDQTASENITYWTSATTVAVGTCGLTVCPVSDDICQLRLDFTTFVITGPSTMSDSQTRRRFGQPVAAGIAADAAVMGSNFATNCLLDHFTVQGPSPSSSPPIVCGTLTATHMYVEADMDRCNKLNFHVADAANALTLSNTRGLATLATRSWDITVTQLECTNVNLPNPGCTQYFWGTSTKTVASYNYQATVGTTTHLANQHQRICIRRERGMCIGCFFGGDADFNISGLGDAGKIYTFVGGCCGYATALNADGATQANTNTQGLASATTSQYGFDCIIIPGAFGPATTIVPLTSQSTTQIQQELLATTAPTPLPPNICGNGKGIGYGAAADIDTVANWAAAAVAGDTVSVSVCTRHVPFTLEFMSDDLEGLGSTLLKAEFATALGTQGVNNGFSLKFAQIACT